MGGCVSTSGVKMSYHPEKKHSTHLEKKEPGWLVGRNNLSLGQCLISLHPFSFSHMCGRESVLKSEKSNAANRKK